MTYFVEHMFDKSNACSYLKKNFGFFLGKCCNGFRKMVNYQCQRKRGNHSGYLTNTERDTTMSVQKTQTKVNAYEFHAEARANVNALNKADSTVERANLTSIDKYLSIGENIRSKNVTAGDYAKAAMCETREEWLAYRAEQMELFATSEGEEGAKDPRPEGQTSCQRALDIAKRFHDERKRLQTLADEHNANVTDPKKEVTPISFLVKEYEAETGKSVTVIDFANWCQGKKSGNTRKEPKDWKFYLSEAINKAFADGADEMMIYAEVDHILGNNAE